MSESDAQKSPVHNTTADSGDDDRDESKEQSQASRELKRDPNRTPFSQQKVMPEDLEIADSDEDVGGPVILNDPDIDPSEINSDDEEKGIDGQPL